MKKKTYIIIFFLNLSLPFYSQITGGDFENFSFTGGDCVPNTGPNLTMSASPFVACSFFGWSASHGSPEVFRNGTIHHATMWSGRWSSGTDVTGEGIFGSCHFYKNKVYHLTLKLACSSSTSGTPNIDNFISNVYIKLATGLSQLSTVSYAPTSSYYVIPTPSSQQTIAQYTGFNSTSWYTVDVYFTADNDYDRLWIYPEHSNGSSHISVLFVDDVSVEDCIPFANYTTTSSFLH
ncbi:MAG: hypothetical protein IPJ32_00195 [Sphingobacteriaceae bacterium]|nr:hypothetical protein [Sphingobacteriaceae bacterium]